MKKKVIMVIVVMMGMFNNIHAQISSGSAATAINEVNNQFRSLVTGFLQLAMYLCGIAGLIGLFVTAYKLWTEDREGMKTVASWAGGLLVATLGLYIVKIMFFQ